uniref:NADH-ubiquinone oxidoreductase chain 4 n=1 Tax=Mecistocephalus marmoratus TaxID=980230 RepID=A0A4Y1K7M6_9MYRI|nr:NADH dehydrogenase subunit 4 [Mecistocephalus marmoratus]ARU77315.1 NADH dehydrogenase subunit 4 [Mecistocephalus marmoratus]
MLGVLFYFFGMMISSIFLSLTWFELVSYIMFGTFLLFFSGGGLVSGYWDSSFGVGWDGLSWSLILLTVWVTGLMIISSVKNVSYSSYLGLMVVLMFLLIITFMVVDFLWFYVFFEGSLVPILLIILGWGYQPERLQAGVYMLFYTLFGSLPLLLSFVYLFMVVGSTNYMFMSLEGGALWYICSILGFLIKMPMFLVHLWLPSAHVEAPVAGSMILAGVLLKLGGYGLFRVLWGFLSVGISFNVIWMSISVLGAVVVSLMCLRQHDMKSLIAYSSVAHMGLVVGGMFTMNGWGWEGGLVLMLGHGLCSSGLFCLANLVYERLGSRSLLVGKGLVGLLPGMCLWWFLLSVSNMAAPPSLNLLGEIMLLVSMVGWSLLLILGLVGVSFFSAVYTLYLYSITQHGSFSLSYGYSDCSVREYSILVLHWAPLNIMVLKSDLCVWWG